MAKIKQRLMSMAIVAAMIISCMPMIGAQAAESAIIFQADFNGADDTANWARFNSGDAWQESGAVAGEVDAENGYLVTKNMTTGYGSWGVYFGVLDDAYQIDSSKENIYVETRFKASEFVENELLTISATRNDNSNQSFFTLTYKDGFLAYGGKGTDNISSYALNPDTWYNLKVRLDYNNQNAYISISDDNGSSADFSTEFLWKGAWTYQNLSQVTTMRTDVGGTFYIDSLKIYDKDLVPRVSATYGDEGKDLNNASGIGESVTVYLHFENAVEAADLDAITVNNGAAVSKSLSEDGKTATLNISGLTVRNKYLLDVPAIGVNADEKFVFYTADDPKYLFRAEFDGRDDQSSWRAIGSDGTQKEFLFDSYINDGMLKIWPGIISYGKLRADFTENPINVKDKEYIFWETKIKIDNVNESQLNEDGSLTDDNQLMFMEDYHQNYRAMLAIRNGGFLAYGGTEGESTYVSDYKMYPNRWYTIRAMMNFKTKTMSVNAVDEFGNSFTGGDAQFSYGLTLENIYLINFTRQLQSSMTTYFDYIRIWDNSMLSHVTATYGEGTVLNNAANLPLSFDAKLTFPEAITEEEAAAVEISTDKVTRELSSDGMTLTLHFADLDMYSPYTITIPETDAYSGDVIKFTTKSEDKYIFRAEFDGYDDMTYWYDSIGDNSNKIETSVSVKNGNMVMDWSSFAYRSFDIIFGDAGVADDGIDLTGKENIMCQMRFKYDDDGKLFKKFFSIVPYLQGGGASVAALGVIDDVLCYGDYASEVDEFGVPRGISTNYKLEAGKYYTLTVKMNFKSYKYSLVITDDAGNIATTPEVNFLYNAKHNTIKRIVMMQKENNGTPTQYIDYVRLWDDDYGKATVTDANGHDLEDSVLVPISGNTFNITLSNEAQTTEGVVIADENGNVFTEDEIIVIPAGNVITLIPQVTFDYNTKYTLTIPKEVSGTEKDQIVNFTTEWDKSKEFVMPPVFEGKDDLNVVFFGGSITQQEGWRVHVTNQIKEWFPNATCINSAVGGTGSEYGWTRLDRDVLSKNPDLVFIEFAVNDSTNTQTTKYMESIVRNINKMENPPVIIFVYTTVLNFDANSYAISEHERLAKAYGIPSISIRDYMRTLYNTNSVFANEWDTTTKYLGDGTHPTELGSQYYGEYVNSLLTSDSLKYFVKPKKNSQVTPLTDFNDYVYEYTALNKTMTADAETYEISFEGDELVLEIGKSKPNGGMYSVTIDGNVVASNKDAYHADNSPSVEFLNFKELGSGSHNAVVTVTGKNETSTGYNVTMNGIYTIKKSGVVFDVPEFDSASVRQGTALTATASYTAYTSENVCLAIALYDADGRFTGFQKLETVTDDSGEERTISVSVTPKAGDVKAKAFLWDNIDNMIPLSENAKIGF